MFYLKQIKIKKEMEYILVFCLFSLKCQCSLGTKYVMCISCIFDYSSENYSMEKLITDILHNSKVNLNLCMP